MVTPTEIEPTIHVAVVIVGFRNSGDVVRCLEALARSTYVEFEVIICENGGTAAFAELTAAIPTILPCGQKVRTFQAPGNLGFAGGVNFCLRESSAAAAWWLLNPDTRPDPPALEAMVKRLGVGDCEAVGSTVYLHDGRVQSHGGCWQPWLARAVSIGRGTPPERSVNRESIERSQNYLNGASFLVGRKFLDAVGPMREDYFLYCEEVEWCLRGAANAMRLGYAQEARVVHDQGTTTGAAEDFGRRARIPVYLGERNRMLLTRDCYPYHLPVAAPAALGRLMLSAVRYRAWRQLGFGLSGWMAGLLNQRDLPKWLRTALS
jgi:N-acetylglucosaminyl-diphospho-decaprenol L-rhamnosyltransferase